MRARFAFLDHPGPIAFAHRGGGLEGPENTWASFTRARDLGFSYMETDVHATSDGVVVTIHDPSLDRTGDRTGLIRSLTWAELSTVRLAGGDERIPRLDELLAAWPEVRWNIDPKHDSVVAPLADTLKRSAAVDRVCVTSFSDRRLGRVRAALSPQLCTAMGPSGITGFRVASLLPSPVGRMAAVAFRRYGAIQIPLRQGPVPLVERRLVDAAHAAGLPVHVWTIDDEVTMARLLDLGVDGIMTDRPSVLKDVLVRRGLWA